MRSAGHGSSTPPALPSAVAGTSRAARLRSSASDAVRPMSRLVLAYVECGLMTCKHVHVRVQVRGACARVCVRVHVHVHEPVRVRVDHLHAQRLLAHEHATLAHRAARRGVRSQEGDHRRRHRSTVGVAEDGRLAAQHRSHLHGQQRGWHWRLEAGTNVPPQQPPFGIEAARALHPGPEGSPERAGAFWPCCATAELVVPRSMPTHAPAAQPSFAPPAPPRPWRPSLATAAPTAAAACASRRLPASRSCLG